jgi:16S rRNA (adenine1518-N6/adenine1519-N6)-dimethyltransferase
LPPSAFWPRPKVHSAILRIDLDDALRGRISDLPFFHEFVRGAFSHRRKVLRSVLANHYRDRIDKPAVDAVLALLGLSLDCRAEQLNVETVLALASAMRERLKSTS